ncbi:uncharacterized protein ACNLHF_022210 [Anomaloglossus baeobatrachus]|uniref:uncharacterized protein LOC142297762 n=1 Tax=Anomaloglossus baeobatrachus TaxID=238106 RepID=UPI003F4FECBA
MHFAADIVAMDEEDYSDEIMEETLFEVPENEHEIKTFMYETWKNISMKTAVYYWTEDKNYMDDDDNNKDYPDEMEDIYNNPDEMEDIYNYPDEIEDMDNYPDEKEDMDDFLDEIWKKTVMETEIYFWPIDFGNVTSLPKLKTIPEEDEEEDGFADYNGNRQDIVHSEVDTDTDKESGYDNISGTEVKDYMDDNEDNENYPDEMADIYNYPDDIEDMDNYPDEMEDMDDFLDEIWKKTVMETEIYFWPIDFGNVTSLPKLKTIPEEEEEKVIEKGDEKRQNMGRVKMKTKADKDELDNASRSYRQWRRLLRFFRETFFCCCSIQTSE